MRLHQKIVDYWEISPPGPAFVDFEEEEIGFFKAIAQDRYEKIPEILTEIGYGLVPGMRVLEIGCGAGTDSEQLIKAGAELVAVDLTKKAVNLTQKRLQGISGNWKVMRADARQLPFEDGMFDQVYSHGVLHHVPEMEACIAEAYRVLKPGGMAKIALYHHDSLYRFYHILYKRGVLERGFETMTKEEILSFYSESREGCPYTRFIRQSEVASLFNQFSSVTFYVASQVKVNRVLTESEIDQIQDQELADFFKQARLWQDAGILEERAGRFLYIRATK